MYTFDSKIRYSEIDTSGKLSLPSLINYFQDCSNFQSCELGLGYEVLKERGRGWVLLAWHIEIHKIPILCQAVTIGTFATDFKGFYGHRNFLMCDEKGEYLAIADSLWVMIDTETGRPTKPALEDYAPYDLGKPLDIKFEGRKIKLAEGSVSFPSFVIQRHHLDTNRHVNNGWYVQMALDVLPEELEIKTLRVEYKKAAVLGDEIFPKLAKEGNRMVVELCDKEGRAYAVVEVKGKKE